MFSFANLRRFSFVAVFMRLFGKVGLERSQAPLRYAIDLANLMTVDLCRAFLVKPSLLSKLATWSKVLWRSSISSSNARSAALPSMVGLLPDFLRLDTTPVLLCRLTQRETVFLDTPRFLEVCEWL